MSGSRRERRESELADRRERRQRQRQRTRRSPSRNLPILPLTLAVLAVAVVGVLVYAFVLGPGARAPTADIRSPAQTAPYDLADGNAIGQANAPLTIEVWSDYQCPACGQLARTYEPLIMAEYVQDGRVRLVMRDFAFLGPESTNAAIATRCAERQGRFWQMHDYLFANQEGEGQGAFSTERLEAMAQAAGLDLEEYRSCRADPQVRDELAAEVEQGRQRGVNSTPTLFIGDQAVAGVPREWAQLEQMIEAQLEAAPE